MVRDGGPAGPRRPFLGPRSGRLVAVGLLRRLGSAGRVSATASAPTLVCGPVGRMDHGRVCGRSGRIRDRLDCTFLSMGHGCAVLLELPSGQTMLYDAGQFGAAVGGHAPISESLWSRGITHLDAVVLSHPDIDHYNALPGLLEKFSVGAIYVSPIMFEKESHGDGRVTNGHRSA